MLNLVFCADLDIVEALQIAVASAIINTPGEIHIYLGRDERTASLVPWVENIAKAACKGRKDVHIFDLSLGIHQFEGLKGLHGNWMTYGRLTLPDRLTDLNKILYLDADIIVNSDLRELYNIDMQDRLLGGVAYTTLRHAKEQSVWSKFKLDLNFPYYNAGVLLMNLAEMRNAKILDKCWQYFPKVEKDFTIVDQTALIVTCYGKWLDLNPYWNFAAWPGNKLPEGNAPKIAHYVGSPKPWDICGCWISPMSVWWKNIYNQHKNDMKRPATIDRYKSKINRAIRISGSYYRAVKKRFA